jgi:hypothetical protein
MIGFSATPPKTFCTDKIAHQECQIGQMDYEWGEVGTDSLPIFHIHRDSLLHQCGINVPPSGQDRQDNVQSPTTFRSIVLSGKGILKSHWPTKLSGRSNPTQEVVSLTSSTSSTLQMETTPGPPGSEIPLPEFPYEKFGNFGTPRLIPIRECCYNYPLPNFPCSQTRPISGGEPMWMRSI